MPIKISERERTHRLETVVKLGNNLLDGGKNPRETLLVMKRNIDVLILGEARTPMDELMDDPKQEASRAS
jgi:hypothetical protein